MSIMNGQKPDSLKRLLQSVPPGFVVDSPWLRANRIGRRSVYEYVKRGWLDRPASGVYRRPLPGRRTSDRVDWRRCVLSMQHIMGYAVHVGAMSALALHGHSHYLPLGEKILWLYGSGFPGWLTRLPLDVALETRSTRSEEHTSELQSRGHLVCRLLLEKKKKVNRMAGKGVRVG